MVAKKPQQHSMLDSRFVASIGCSVLNFIHYGTVQNLNSGLDWIIQTANVTKAMKGCLQLCLKLLPSLLRHRSSISKRSKVMCILNFNALQQ